MRRTGFFTAGLNFWKSSRVPEDRNFRANQRILVARRGQPGFHCSIRVSIFFLIGPYFRRLELSENRVKMTLPNERVAKILTEELTPTIQRWINRVNEVPELARIKLSYQERTGHLPQLLQDLITRLGLADSKKSPETTSAHDHGKVRFEQAYTVPMLVEESRLLQVGIFETLNLNHRRLDTSLLLSDVMIIADECDAQLKHTVETFIKLENDHKRGGNEGLQIPA